MSEKEAVKDGRLELTIEQLQTIVATASAEAAKVAVQELRKPSDKELLNIEQQQAERERNAKDYAKMAADKKAYQKICNHYQNQGKDKTKTGMVFNNGNYDQFLVCQRCQIFLKPGEMPKKGEAGYNQYDPYTYNTQLFNEHFQMLNFE